MSQDERAAELHAAVRGFLDGFTDWVTARTPDGDDAFDAFWQHLHPDAELVMPSGATVSQREAQELVRESHGSNPTYAYRLTDVRVVTVGPEHGVLTCKEWQENALTGPQPINGRVTTVMLLRHDGAMRLRFVHQTWLPADGGA